jgi:DNA-binding NtrC family response regulator
VKECKLSLTALANAPLDVVRWPRVQSRLSLLVDLSAVLGREIAIDSILDLASVRLSEALDAERATVWVLDAADSALVSRTAISEALGHVRLPVGSGIAGAVAQTGQVVRTDNARNDARFHAAIDQASGFVSRSMLAVPIRSAKDAPIRGVVQVLNARSGTFTSEDELYLVALCTQLSRALELTSLGASDTGFLLQGPINRIVGQSEALREVYLRVERAAKTDATVLLRGETGTGKGLFAKAIHVNSPRNKGPLITVDATTLPRELIESELFGHERGAFTGADRRVIGKLEQAQAGTVFLDEVGDLPLDLQARLLRVLQDRVLTRVGGREEIHIDVRFVAATHKDLERGVAEGWFREDLYYRLKVVEIAVPPLRERGASDLEALAMHFALTYARRYGKPAPKLSADAWAHLQAHHFPGNVRELEHWVESAVVLSDTGELTAALFPKAKLTPTPQRDKPADVSTATIPAGLSLSEAIRHYAEHTLQRAGNNQSEAAKMLGIGRNTLKRYLDGETE